MPRNKPRLQLALYARPKHPGSYHYALFVAPKSTKGPMTKHHVKNTVRIDAQGEATHPWRYEGTTIESAEEEYCLLARVIVAKVTKSSDDVQRIVESVPITQVDEEGKAEAEAFTCRTWVRDVFLELNTRGAIVTPLQGGWEEVERKALEYLGRKREQGRWEVTWTGGPGVPLLDLLEGKDVVE